MRDQHKDVDDVELGSTWRPSEFLYHAERIAHAIRKRFMERKSVTSGQPASTDDAEKLAELIESLARMGQRTDAAEAVEIVEQVERLLDMLAREIDQLCSPESGMCG